MTVRRVRLYYSIVPQIAGVFGKFCDFLSDPQFNFSEIIYNMLDYPFD